MMPPHLPHQVPVQRLRLARYMCVFVLTACASAPELALDTTVACPPAPAPVAAYADLVAKGKVGMKTPGLNGTVGFVLRRDAEGFFIQLSGPLGIGRTSFYGNWQQDDYIYELIDKDKGLAKPHALAAFGLPASSLLDQWMHGVAQDADPTTVAYDTAGRVTRFAAGDWRIQFRNYKTDAQFADALPHLLVAERSDGARVRIGLSSRSTCNQARV